MAKLALTIGSVTADITIPDATAQQIVAEYNEACQAPDGMNNRQALEWFVRHLAGHAKAVSDAHGVEAVVRTVRDAERERREAVKIEGNGGER